MKKKLTSAPAIFLTMIIAFSAVVIPATATDESVVLLSRKGGQG